MCLSPIKLMLRARPVKRGGMGHMVGAELEKFGG